MACRPANQRSVVTQGGIWCRCSLTGMCLSEATSATQRGKIGVMLSRSSDTFPGLANPKSITCSWADNAEIVAWARANNLSVTSAVESVGGEGSVFGWGPDDRCFLSLDVRGRLSNSESAVVR